MRPGPAVWCPRSRPHGMAARHHSDGAALALCEGSPLLEASVSAVPDVFASVPRSMCARGGRQPDGLETQARCPSAGGPASSYPCCCGPVGLLAMPQGGKARGPAPHPAGPAAACGQAPRRPPGALGRTGPGRPLRPVVRRACPRPGCIPSPLACRAGPPYGPVGLWWRWSCLRVGPCLSEVLLALLPRRGGRPCRLRKAASRRSVSRSGSGFARARARLSGGCRRGRCAPFPPVG